MKSVKTTTEKATKTTAKTTAAKTGTAKTSTKSKATPKVEETAPTEEVKTEEVKKSAPTTKSKVKKTPTDNTVKVGKSTSKEHIIPLADMFPEEMELFNVEFRAAREIKTYEDLLKVYENYEGNVYIAAYWNKRHLRQFNYGEQFHLNKFNLKQFKDDLDMLSVAYVSDFEGEPVAVAVSSYTGAVYKFFGNEIPEIVDEDEGYRLRVSNGMEYEIYVDKDADLKDILK